MYFSFYGLKHEPFRLTPDPRFLHMAEPHRNALRTMLEAVTTRKGLQVCVGPIGTGKTTLLYCLQHILLHESSPQRPIRSAFIVNPVLTGLELFQAIFEDMEIAGPTVQTKPACLRSLHEVICEGSGRNGTLLVIIDEAHLMSPELLEEIRLLLNLDNHSVTVLQILLSGQPELLGLLAKPQFAALKQRVSMFSRLRALTQVETRAYIVERLHVAGLRGESPFSPPALQEIHQVAAGVPRLINSVCDRAMSLAFARHSFRIGPEYILEAAEDLALLESSVEASSPMSSPSMVSAASQGFKP
jgi:general secretion pathway protein A